MLLKKVVKKTPTAAAAVKKAVPEKLTEPDVRWVPIDSIKQWPDNPMAHNKDDIEILAKILGSHEQRSPVIVWRKNSVIYKGNGTHAAMKKNGKKMIKAQFEDFPSEAAAKAYGIADNKASELSDWDEEVLAGLLTSEEMKQMKPELGFTDSELRGITFESDEESIGKITKTDTGIKATVKIHCKPEDRDAIREVLNEWSKDCGYDEVVVK